MRLGAFASKKQGSLMHIPLTKEQIDYYANRYEDLEGDRQIELSLAPAIERGYVTKAELIVLVRWKAARVVWHAERNSDADVREITQASFGASSSLVRLKFLTILHGFSWAMASALLHFIFPKECPVLDFRAMNTVGGPPRNYEKDEVWEEYAALCCKTAKDYGISLRKLDRALWQYDLDNLS